MLKEKDKIQSHLHMSHDTDSSHNVIKYGSLRIGIAQVLHYDKLPGRGNLMTLKLRKTMQSIKEINH